MGGKERGNCLNCLNYLSEAQSRVRRVTASDATTRPRMPIVCARACHSLSPYALFVQFLRTTRRVVRLLMSGRRLCRALPFPPRESRDLSRYFCAKGTDAI